MKKNGLLLTNTGTPDAPTSDAVRQYLAEFLSDKRIVSLPQLVWLPILYGLVLTLRPKRSAQLYKKIWTDNGSPMKAFINNIVTTLNSNSDYMVAAGMNYGNPSIQSAINQLTEQGAEDIIVLPLYPQYSFATTASTYDRVAKAIKCYKTPPSIHLVHDYATEPAYINALKNATESYWIKNGRGQHLLMSFHGIPERFVRAGDPYARQCEATANLLAKAMGLSPAEWTLCYQSQFGYDKWLKPSTQDLFEALPAKGVTELDIICPGFSVDCLETLEEIAIAGKKAFLDAGGKKYHFIPCLNDSSQHTEMLLQLADKRSPAG